MTGREKLILTQCNGCGLFFENYRLHKATIKTPALRHGERTENDTILLCDGCEGEARSGHGVKISDPNS